MYIRVEGNDSAKCGILSNGQVRDHENFFFDARPARILRTTNVKLEDDDRLYAGYSYGFEANGKGNASIAHMLEKADADKYPDEIAGKKLFCD